MTISLNQNLPTTLAGMLSPLMYLPTTVVSMKSGITSQDQAAVILLTRMNMDSTSTRGGSLICMTLQVLLLPHPLTGLAPMVVSLCGSGKILMPPTILP